MRDTFTSKVHRLSDEVQSGRAGQPPSATTATPAPAAGENDGGGTRPPVNGQPNMTYRKEDRTCDSGEWNDSLLICLICLTALGGDRSVRWS